MDEGDLEDVAAVSRAEDVRAQGKEGEFLVEHCSMLESRERVIVREEDLPRTSVQQFVDLLNGKDPTIGVNIVDVSENQCTGYGESREGRVQELTLGHCSSGLDMMNGGEIMEDMIKEWQDVNRPGVGLEAEASHGNLNHKEKRPATISSWEDSRSADVLSGQLAGHNANLTPTQSNYNESDAVLREALSTGAMRMKVISKSSGFPEYFVKNSLKGKGVLCRGPMSAAAEVRGQNIVKAASTSTTTSNIVNVREISAVPSPSNDGTASSDGVSHDSGTDGANLREWMRSGRTNVHKVDSQRIFKEILDLVCSFHSDGKVLLDLRPSFFRLLPCRKIKYCGRLSAQKEMHGGIVLKDVQKSQPLKRPLEQGMSPYIHLGAKRKKSTDNVKCYGMKSQFHLGYGLTPVTHEIDANLAGPGDHKAHGNTSRLHLAPSTQQHAVSVVDQSEEKWYRSPEELFGRSCTCSSNIYCLGVLLFELLSSFESGKGHGAAMADIRHRILPPNFLSENPKEAGFCLWLLHPEPSLRPTARDILNSEVVSGFQALCHDDSSSIQEDEGESELLMHFLMSLKEQKQIHASNLEEDLGCIEADVRELEKRYLLEKPARVAHLQEFLYAGERCFLSSEEGLSNSVSDRGDSRFTKNVAQLESAYFSARSQIRDTVNGSMIREDIDILENRENFYAYKNDQKPLDDRGAFFDGLCKYARYTKFEVCGTLRNREISNSTNVICSLSFDRDEDYFAAAGVSKKIKIFDFQALCDNSVDIHYPVIEMSNKSKLSCVCWNSYIRNYLASTDYDGIVKLWDASTGQEFSHCIEHEKRAWSVDFSQLDPTKLASGSDDCSVKLWSISERNSLQTIRNIANVCCVQFSAHSSHLLAFGSADYKIYCYDLRNANVPWCVLAGHEKAVSYVKFVDSGTLVSASTDNTLKLWDLSRSTSGGFSNKSCSLTLRGHTNEKNFVGLSVADGYVACGSETNEVYTYYNSLPMPITSHKFGSIDPISGKETDDDNGQFVSSVCWKGKSNQLVAANSSGCIKVLQMV